MHDSLLSVDANDVQAFINDLAREYFLDGPDRRGEPRLRITIPVALQPLTDDREPLDYRIRAVTRDISSSGIGLVCQDPIAAKLVTIRFRSSLANELEVVAQVLRCRPVGYYFDVGCRFDFSSFESPGLTATLADLHRSNRSEKC